MKKSQKYHTPCHISLWEEYSGTTKHRATPRNRFSIPLFTQLSLMKPTLLALASIFCFHAGTDAAGSSPPNILFISIDDLNNWVGYLGGHPQVKTPHMDRLAKRGVAFTDAHCTTPICKPSRTAILTGLSETKTGVFQNGNDFDRSSYTLLPQHFAKHGYQTFGTGKLHHSKSNHKFFQSAFNPEQRWSPFDKKEVRYSSKEQASKSTSTPQHVLQNGPGNRDYTLPFNGMPSERSPKDADAESFDWASFDLPDNAFGDGQITQWAIEQLKGHSPEKPFFMGVGYYRPHIPLYAPKEYFDLYPLDSLQLPEVKQGDLDDVPPLGQERARSAVTAGTHALVQAHSQWKQAVQAYLACVSFIDAQVGQLLDYLQESPHADNTIIVLFSDHGWHLGEKQAWGKFSGWIHSTHVPLIIAPVGATEMPNCKETVSLLDLFPTLVEMAGIPSPELDGMSLVPLLENPTQSSERVVQTWIGKGTYSLINKEWHLIHYEDGEEELYNRKLDPLEFNNLAKKEGHAEVIQHLKDQP